MRAWNVAALLVLIVSLAAGAASQTAAPESTQQGKDEDSGANGDLYKVGGAITPPRAIYRPDPQYSKKARKAKLQGTCVLWLIVGADGKPRNIRVQRAVGMGLDEEAIKAVQKWTFEPARKDGQPVDVQINVEVSFHLY